MGNCAGVDWASEKHDVIVAEESGEELLADCDPTLTEVRAASEATAAVA